MTPNELQYTAEHEWIRIEGETGTVGITDYAQSQLGDVVFVELPEVGAEFAKGEVFGVIESVKSVSDLYLPVSGRVVKVNEALIDAPEKINEQPYSDGWIVQIELTRPEEADDLLDAEAYAAQTDSE
ncbi:MAG TPA: glycine cleavage system protein GcvH [Limnochordia bacterium]|nr:glycine cleavage system protein GcvH [Limnochordia bacterium]